MNNTIHFNEIMGTNVKRFTTASELLLAFELNKYTQKMLDKAISIEGIEVIKNIEKSEHYSFVVNNGFNVGRVLELDERENLAPYTSNLYFSGDVEGIIFKEQTADVWVYERDFAIENNILHRAYVSNAYISLVAYMYVDSYIKGVSVPKLIIDHENHSQLADEYVDLLILRDWGNKILKSKLDIKFCTAKGHQPEWEAFVAVNRQRGYMTGRRIVDKKRNVSYEPYSRDVKIKYLAKNFEVGDVVLYYLRDTSGKKIGKLESCYPAVIKAFNPNGTITLAYYPINETRLTRNIEISNMIEMSEDENVYTESDYNKFHESIVTFDINDIGIDKATYLEPVFILKPLDTDGSYQYFDTPDGYKRVWLSTYDTIYAVFEDRGVKYNKDKFLRTYFTNDRTPVYEVYKDFSQENMNKEF